MPSSDSITTHGRVPGRWAGRQLEQPREVVRRDELLPVGAAGPPRESAGARPRAARPRPSTLVMGRPSTSPPARTRRSWHDRHGERQAERDPGAAPGLRVELQRSAERLHRALHRVHAHAAPADVVDVGARWRRPGGRRGAAPRGWRAGRRPRRESLPRATAAARSFSGSMPRPSSSSSSTTRSRVAAHRDAQLAPRWLPRSDAATSGASMPVVDGVPEHVEQRLGDGVEDGAVDLDLRPGDGHLHVLAPLAGEVASGAGELVGDHRHRRHPGAHHLAVEVLDQRVEAVDALVQRRALVLGEAPADVAEARRWPAAARPAISRKSSSSSVRTRTVRAGSAGDAARSRSLGRTGASGTGSAESELHLGNQGRAPCARRRALRRSRAPAPPARRGWRRRGDPRAEAGAGSPCRGR